MTIGQDNQIREVAPLRVLMICPQFRPLVGGYERAAERISTALAKSGIRVVVITERRDKTWPLVENSDGYEIRRLPCWYRQRVHILSSLLFFAGFLLRNFRNFDIWHVHQYGAHAALAVVLGKLLRRPVVLKLTSSSDMGIEQFFNHGLTGRALGAIHRRVDACLALTEETREEARRFGIPPQRTYLIPNGVDGHQFHPVTPEERAAARRTLGLDCQRLVLYVGRLSPEKNPLGLLDAWFGIDAGIREGTLLAMLGDGPEKDKVKAKVQSLNLKASVNLAGRRSDVSTWYQAADVYVVSSYNEGLSNAMIEALASGLPIVATRVSGTSVLVEPPVAGLVVNIGDMQQLSQAMALLLNDDKMRNEFGQNARQSFDTHFSLINLIPRLISVYNTKFL